MINWHSTSIRKGKSLGWSSGFTEVFRRWEACMRNQLAFSWLLHLCCSWQPPSIALLIPSAFRFFEGLGWLGLLAWILFVCFGVLLLLFGWVLWGFFCVEFFSLNQDTFNLKIKNTHWFPDFFTEVEQVSSHSIMIYSEPRDFYLLFPHINNIVWDGAMKRNQLQHDGAPWLKTITCFVSVDHLWAYLRIIQFHFCFYNVYCIFLKSTLEQNLSGKTALPWKCSSSSLSTWTAPSSTLPFFLAGKLSLPIAL